MREERHTQSDPGTNKIAHIPQCVVNGTVGGSVLRMNKFDHKKRRAFLLQPQLVIEYPRAYWAQSNLCNSQAESKDHATNDKQGNMKTDGNHNDTAYHNYTAHNYTSTSTEDVCHVWNHRNGKHGTN
jgi:hypothetical protein